MLAAGDIVIARTGATVGYAKLIRDDKDSVFASYLVRIRVNCELADKIEIAIGRSKIGPAFFTFAGAKFIVTFFAGN